MTVLAGHFGPVDRRTVAQEVRDRLYEAIRSGALPAGAPLPSERSLCEDFGVARTSVREAIQGLVSRGLLVRRSNRTYVAELLPDLPVAHSDQRKITVHELFEVREAIELPMVRLTVARASDREREEIASLASQFSTSMAVEEFRVLDRAFHWKLAASCGNELLAELYGKVLDTLFHSTDFASLLSARVNQRAVRQIVRDSCSAHRHIADAILRRSPDDVAAAMSEHLQQVESHLIARTHLGDDVSDNGSRQHLWLATQSTEYRTLKNGFRRRILTGDDMMVALWRIKDGEGPTPYDNHPVNEQFGIILRGQLDFRLNSGERTLLNPGDVYWAPRGCDHGDSRFIGDPETGETWIADVFHPPREDYRGG